VKEKIRVEKRNLLYLFYQYKCFYLLKKENSQYKVFKENGTVKNSLSAKFLVFLMKLFLSFVDLWMA
jgi:hypothetical protein